MREMLGEEKSPRKDLLSCKKEMKRVEVHLMCVDSGEDEGSNTEASSSALNTALRSTRGGFGGVFAPLLRLLTASSLDSSALNQYLRHAA
jgi:hypothetical protein